MNQTVAEKKSGDPAGLLSANFDFVRFLSDLFGLEPAGAYPVGSWSEYCAAMFGILDDADYRRTLAIYDIADPSGENLAGNRRFINQVQAKCRETKEFSDFAEIIRRYEDKIFCSFSGDLCVKCRRPRGGSFQAAPICFGRRLYNAERVERMVKRAGKEQPELVDESEEFAKRIASQLGQEFKSGSTGDFCYDFLLAGVPTFIWRFRDFEMEESVLLDLLARAEAADIKQLYIAAYSHLVCRIPITVPGRIPYVVLPLAAEDDSVPVFDYVSEGDVVGKPN